MSNFSKEFYHRLAVGYNKAQRFADLRWAGFSAQMFYRSTELSITTKLSAEHETPPIANVLLAADLLVSLMCFFGTVNVFK